MAERNRDAEDRWLESMFAAEPIEDAGFSAQVLRRVRLRLWVRRLALPVAIGIGGAIAFKPMLQLLAAGNKLVAVLPRDLVKVPADWLPNLSMLVVGGVLLGLGLLTMRMLEE